jgi:hypothetical protein
MTVLFIACFIGIPLAVVSVTDTKPVIYATFGVLAVVFLVGMWLLARRFRPAAAGHFEVLAQSLELRRGEELEADLTIHYPEDVGERLEVGLVCVERYDRPVSTRTPEGETVVDRAIAQEVAYESWLPAWRSEEQQVFRFRIPRDAPYSYEGDCLSFAWRVSAREPDEGAAEDSVSEDPIWVLP